MGSVQILEGTYGGPRKRIAYIVSNPATLKGVPVGFFAEELTRPFGEFVDAGHEVEIFSPKGGRVEFDFFSDPEHQQTIYPNDLSTIGFKHHATFGSLLDDTRSIQQLDVASFDAVCVAGGGGPLITFKVDTGLHKLIADFYEQGKVVGLICHGTSLMLWARLSDGTMLADGKTWTGYSDAEEEMNNQAAGTTLNDYTIESEAKKMPGTTFKSAPPLQRFAIRDGRVITAQQQHSGGLFSRLVLEALAEQPV